MRKFSEYKKECLKDPEFLKEYELLQPEMTIVRILIEQKPTLSYTEKNGKDMTSNISFVPKN